LDDSQIPDTVLEKAREFQIEISLEQWQKLQPSQRFALIKLSRPSHENLNFYPALKEFHIVDA
ncbi:MAG: nitrate reductase associated protein, partial [Microcystis panniformis]